MELTELVRGAQNAMDRGDYHLAAKACTHALESYPVCMSAHRILGESLLERGETDAAIGHFDHALALDPLSVVARLGLGVAAEERKDSGLAYAHYLHAWEINPALDQVRGQLVRLRAALGSHDRLHPTRAGLAGIHARSGQLGRAASEWRAILAVDPESTRARTSLAEVLWRAGDDAGAIGICREILRVSPDNARALAMLADIEKRVGAPTANELVERYQSVDPMGEVAEILSELREGADLSFLTPSSPSLPDFDFEAVAAESPALPVVEQPVAAPMAPSLAASHVAAPDLWDTLVRDLQHDAADPAEAESGSIQPFSWSDDGSVIDLGPAVEPFSLEGLQDLDDVVAAEVALPVAAAIDHIAEVELLAPPPANGATRTGPREPALDLAAIMNPEPFVAPAAAVASAASVVAEPLFVADAVVNQTPAATPAPVPAAMAPAPARPAANPFVTADGRVDLTIGWDDIDRQLKAATPTDEGARGYEDLVAELDAGGFAPFAADDGSAMSGAWEPFTADEVDAPPPAVAEVPAIAEPEPVPTFEDEVLGVAPAAMPWGEEVDPVAVPADWVDIDDDLIAAIPSPQPSGYTELLRHVDNDEPVQIPVAEELTVDPFATPDTSGDPLGFEDLLTVTSRDGTSELGPVETDLAAIAFALDELPVATAGGDLGFDAAAFDWSEETPPVMAEAQPALAEATGLDGVADDLGGIEPFTFDDLVGAGGEPAGGVDFSDLEDVFAPVPYAAQAPFALEEPFAAEEPFGMAEPFAVDESLAVDVPFAEGTFPQVAFAAEPLEAVEPEVPLADIGGIDWGAAFAVDEAPVAAVATVEEHETDAESVIRWPTFIGHTSDLIDRERAGLFGRLRAAKEALVAEGAVTVDRSVAPRAPAVLATIEEVDEVVRQVAARPRLAAIDGEPVAERPAESSGLDLTAMRVRLIESESAAAEIAETLEAAIAQGDVDPLAMRVLGEAYLRLGRTEQAAAQFRQAMLARRRAR